MKSESKPVNNQEKANLSSLFLDLLFSVFIPAFILKKFSGDDALGPSMALVVALSFPIALGIRTFIQEKKVGFIPAIGFLNTLLTGGIGLLKLPTEYIAYKEAAVPLVFGFAVWLTSFTQRPLAKVFIFNDLFIKTDLVEEQITSHKKATEFEQTMIRATWMIMASFLLSAILNFVLAKWIVVSESGTDAFMDELGTLTLYSFPMIALPCMVITTGALFYVFSRIQSLTGLDAEEIVRQ